MTVRDLIERLSALDPSLPVIIPSEDGDFAEVRGAYEDLVQSAETGFQLADEREGGMRVVRLFEAGRDVQS